MKRTGCVFSVSMVAVFVALGCSHSHTPTSPTPSTNAAPTPTPNTATPPPAAAPTVVITPLEPFHAGSPAHLKIAVSQTPKVVRLDFGDEIIAEVGAAMSVDLVHIFLNVGTFTVTATATLPDGTINTATAVVVVS